MQIYLLEIPQTLEVFCANNDVLVKYLTADEKHLLEPKNLAQMASILGKIAIRYLLKKYFPNEYTLQPFSKAQSGKPYFASLPNWHFNISHTKRWVAIAISDQEVGIDVEGIRSYKKEVAKRFFSSAEYLYLETVSLDKQERQTISCKITGSILQIQLIKDTVLVVTSQVPPTTHTELFTLFYQTTKI